MSIVTIRMGAATLRVQCLDTPSARALVQAAPFESSAQGVTRTDFASAPRVPRVAFPDSTGAWSSHD